MVDIIMETEGLLDEVLEVEELDPNSLDEIGDDLLRPVLLKTRDVFSSLVGEEAPPRVPRKMVFLIAQRALGDRLGLGESGALGLLDKGVIWTVSSNGKRAFNLGGVVAAVAYFDTRAGILQTGSRKVNTLAVEEVIKTTISRIGPNHPLTQFFRGAGSNAVVFYSERELEEMGKVSFRDIVALLDLPRRSPFDSIDLRAIRRLALPVDPMILPKVLEKIWQSGDTILNGPTRRTYDIDLGQVGQFNTALLGILAWRGKHPEVSNLGQLWQIVMK